MSDHSIPIGFCQCGCGGRTSIAKANHKRKQQVKGQPVRFIAGHQSRKRSPVPLSDNEKYCHGCAAVKTTDDFHVNQASRDGLGTPCKDCVRERQRRLGHSRREQWRRWRLEYYYRNHEVKKVQHRDYQRQWARDNTDKVQRSAAIYRAHKRANGGSFTWDEWLDLCQRYDNRCLRCGEERALTVDHIIPVSRGGTSDICNLQPLCRACNASKSTQILDYR